VWDGLFVVRRGDGLECVVADGWFFMECVGKGRLLDGVRRVGTACDGVRRLGTAF
jgi:hypothetical protein